MNAFKSLIVGLAMLLSSAGAASAQAPVIISFSQNGELVCSNLVVGSVASVEWASTLAGPWHTNWAGLDAVTVSSNGTITVGVPMFYRVRGFSPSPSTVITADATSITSSGATLNGAGNPNGAATTGWFRYSTVHPGSGNDTFGTRVPASSANDPALGAGLSPVAYSQAITGLAPGTTYYYCAITSSAQGTRFGPVLSFTTAAVAPVVTTAAATSVTSSGAALNGLGNPGGAAATGWFRYSATSPGTGNDSFGTRVPSSSASDSALGPGNSPVAFSQAISGLSLATTYYYCAIVSNSEGTSLGQLLTFTTSATAPTVTTSDATSVTSSGATLNGAGNPNGASATGWFRYSTTSPGTGNDTFGTRLPASPANDPALGAGLSPVAYAQAISGLAPGTTYYYCAISANAQGTRAGPVLSFTTAAVAPVVTTVAATSVTSTGATLNGTGNPGGAATTGWFRYSTVSPGSGNDSFGTRVPASSASDSALGTGNSPVAFSQAIAGLSSGTTYYYVAIAANARGTTFGPILTFTTP